MDITNTMEKIKAIWEENQFNSDLVQIKILTRAGSTGSEIIYLIAEYFVKIKKEQSKSYLVTAKYIDYYLSNFV